MRVPFLNIAAVAAVAAAAAVLVARNSEGHAAHHLLNVSYDPTRELYQAINPAFVKIYEAQTGSSVEVRQSHAGSSYQARRVANGELAADVVTLGLPSDVDGLRKRGLIAEGWRDRLPNESRPYASTIVFVTRKGNPHAVHDWPDLLKPGLEVIFPDPKTSGNGKLAVLAAWGSVVTRGGTPDEAKALLRGLFERVPFFEPAARSAGVAFSVEKKGDVHLAWENEALREVAQSKGALEIVYPPVSIRAEPSVAWVDANVARRGSEKLARAYLDFLFTEEAQEIIAENGYRPENPAVLERHRATLPKRDLFEVTAFAKSWSDAQQIFFAENGVLDQVYLQRPRND